MIFENIPFENINNSSDFVSGEQKLPCENQNNDLDFQNEPYYFDAGNPLAKSYDSDFYFKPIINKMSSTGESSNDKDYNLIQKIIDDNFQLKCQNIESKENDKLKSHIFQTIPPKKRGRTKKIDVIRKIHGKTDDDNVLTKLQTHFLKFLINVCNDIIEPYLKKEKNNKYFRQINYKIKKNITADHINALKSCKIKDIFKMEISKKYREYDKDNNKQVYDFICDKANKNEKLRWIINFFEMNYLDFFENYYYTDKRRNYFSFQNNKINFSEKTKSFYNLLEKNRNNPEIQECLIRISKRYLKRIKQPSQKIFLITKTQK